VLNVDNPNPQRDNPNPQRDNPNSV